MKLKDDQLYTMLALQREFNLSYQQLADWYYKHTGVKISAKQIYVRLTEIKQKMTP